MITRPVALVRALIVTAICWAAGSAAILGLFTVFDASATIDLQGQQDRVQVVWLGAHAFVVCVAALLGVCLGGSALAHAGNDSPATSGILVALATWVMGVCMALVLAGLGHLHGSTLLAVLAGLSIGAAGGFVFVIANGAAEGDVRFGQQGSRREGRSWSSR